MGNSDSYLSDKMKILPFFSFLFFIFLTEWISESTGGPVTPTPTPVTPSTPRMIHEESGIPYSSRCALGFFWKWSEMSCVQRTQRRRAIVISLPAGLLEDAPMNLKF